MHLKIYSHGYEIHNLPLLVFWTPFHENPCFPPLPVGKMFIYVASTFLPSPILFLHVLHTYRTCTSKYTVMDMKYIIYLCWGFGLHFTRTLVFLLFLRGKMFSYVVSTFLPSPRSLISQL